MTTPFPQPHTAITLANQTKSLPNPISLSPSCCAARSGAFSLVTCCCRVIDAEPPPCTTASHCCMTLHLGNLSSRIRKYQLEVIHGQIGSLECCSYMIEVVGYTSHYVEGTLSKKMTTEGLGHIVNSNTMDFKKVDGEGMEKDGAVFDDFHEAGDGGKNHLDDDSDDEKEPKELQDASHLCWSPTRNRPSNPESRKTCYLCGKEGHEMWKCPSQLKRPTRSQLLCQSSDASPEPSTSGNNMRLLRRGDSPQHDLLPAAGNKSTGRGKGAIHFRK
ncbi:unnamed protein product [Fraxinus pennsylvanica]|uniref:CCHC-type domain-containing protein n=1 Tax=Fraxinus pennsylvanica TaxID=56036 RepID=A0AAD2A2H9_9LAMI|nr:unnamed protein product [Fraxinus pennsylvanica]